MSTKPLCRHCGRRFAWQSRGLCRICHDDKGIRDQYRPKRNTRPPINMGLAILPVMSMYPNHAARVRCEHGRLDGECAVCEAKQRSEMVFVMDRDEEEVA